MNPQVDIILEEGCGRCKLVGTPQCRIIIRNAEMQALREIALESGLDEEVKWGFPAYTFKKKNIFMLGSFKEYSSIMFFKGALLSDPENILVQPTENSNSGRQLRFTNAKEVLKIKNHSSLGSVVFNLMPNENHATILHNSLYQGFLTFLKK